MKKNILAALVLGLALSMTGCGGSDAVEAPTQEEVTEAVTEVAEAVVEEVADKGAMEVDDEAFSKLQDEYAELVDIYNAVKDAYENGSIDPDSELEGIMNEAADVINQMGEIDRTEITNADVADLEEAMDALIDGLSAVGDAIDLAEVANAAQDAAGDIVSDEDFEVLQENFAILVDCYNATKELYENDEIDANAAIEEALNEAADVINEMSEIQQNEITVEDADVLNDSMATLIDAFGTLIDAM